MNTLHNQNIDAIVEKGNLAIKKGKEDECLEWYYLALKKAVELKNKIKENEVSNLIFTLL